MPGPVDTSGPIETFCSRADAPASRRSVFSFDNVVAGDKVSLCFNAGEDTKPPYSLRVRSPNGSLIVDRILRDLPTGLPQSEPPIDFIVSVAGKYVVDIRELSGKSWGQATITVD